MSCGLQLACTGQDIRLLCLRCCRPTMLCLSGLITVSRTCLVCWLVFQPPDTCVSAVLSGSLQTVVQVQPVCIPEPLQCAVMRLTSKSCLCLADWYTLPRCAPHDGCICFQGLGLVHVQLCTWEDKHAAVACKRVWRPPRGAEPVHGCAHPLRSCPSVLRCPALGRGQVTATCKHFAAYSLEAADGFTRNSFDAQVDARWVRACSQGTPLPPPLQGL